MLRARTTLAAAALPLITGCTLLHSVDEDRGPPLPVPDGFASQRTSTSTATAPGRWWEAFGDSELDRLIGIALADNLDLKGAFSRLDQAEALARGAGAGQWPQLSAEANAGRTRVQFNAGTGPRSFTVNTFSLSAAASYEVNLWGRVYSLKNAAAQEHAALHRDVESMVMTLAARVTETWFGIVAERSRLALLREQTRANETYLELVRLRFQQGLTSALDVFQQTQVTVGTRAQIPLAEANLAVLENQLAVLLGRAPGSGPWGDKRSLPSLPPPPSPGLPAVLLARRPDVEAARLRVVAADHRVGAAIADRFPTLRLTARAGFQNPELANLFKDWVWNVAAGLVGPIFDGGRLAAEVDRNEAVLHERLSAYAQTVLVAIEEVEDALVREQKQRAHLGELSVQLDVARKTLTEARSRYLNGLSDYLPVLTALGSLQRLEQSEVGARRQLLSYRIQLCRALGGTWAEEVERPEMLSEVDRRKPRA